ncbi:MAG: YhcH/YjgK/YiaL family protein [Saprospiraceae bacterium]|nr:YhcH/YjgK/YiaL family protein [Saprospiraceae bacterium]
MKASKLFIPVILLLFLTSCKSADKKNNREQWTDEQVATWFNQKEWLGQTALQVDSSLDKREFAIQYHKYKDRWDRAFDFFKKEDLAAVQAGNHPLDDQNVFVKCTEYFSKDRDKVLFENHKNYADIHYVATGTEYIELGSPTGAVEKTPYNAEKDIAFYESTATQTFVGKPGTMYIIFSPELHRSGIRVEDSVQVKKIVIKVKN